MVWAHMLQRCSNPKTSRYHRYGGRGIKVCDRWHNFLDFYSDMGQRPSPKHTIDRIDNDGNYEPGNCRWATKREQNHNKAVNRYVTYRGQRISLTKAVEIAASGTSMGAVRGRLQRGWLLEEALETPPDPNVYVPSRHRHPR